MTQNKNSGKLYEEVYLGVLVKVLDQVENTESLFLLKDYLLNIGSLKIRDKRISSLFYQNLTENSSDLEIVEEIENIQNLRLFDIDSLFVEA